jgi:hypothetical protein
MSGVEPMVGFDAATADPIEALLLARAGLRKEPITP